MRPAGLKYESMHDALAALSAAQDDESQGRVIVAMQGLSLEAPDQLTSLYDYAIGFEKKATATNLQLYDNFTGAIFQIIARVDDARYDHVLAGALGKEIDSMPAHYNGVYGARTHDQYIRFEMRDWRLVTLVQVVGRIKDRQALPALRRLLADDGLESESAAVAIGKIGDPGDLEDMIRRMEKHPAERHFSLHGFDATALDRVLQEIDKPSVPDNARGAMCIMIRYWLTPANKSQYIKLLDHPDEQVRREAAQALLQAAKPGDEELVVKLAHAEDGSTRLEAVGGMAMIWAPQFMPIATDMLLHDESPIIRGAVAKLFENNKVVAALPQLQQATGDRDAGVREDVQEAIVAIQSELTLVLTTEKRAIRVGDPFRYRLEIKNTGTLDIDFGKNNPGIKNESDLWRIEFNALVKYPAGFDNNLKNLPINRNAPPDSNDNAPTTRSLLLPLHPGESIATAPDKPGADRFRILQIFRGLEPGKYSIRFVYNVVHQGLRASSNAVDVEIIP